MKIVLLAPEFLPVWGGVGTYVVELIRNFPRDVEVHVMTPFRKGIGGSELSSADYDFGEMFHDNVHVHFVSTASDTFWYNAKFQLGVARELKRLVKRETPDLVHSNAAHMPDLLVDPRGLGVPIVTTIHTTLEGQLASVKDAPLSDLEFSEKMTRLMAPILLALEGHYYRHRHHFITVSHIGKKTVSREKRIPAERIRVIYNGVDASRFSPSNRKMAEALLPDVSDVDAVKVLYLSRLIGKKGIYVLLRAIPRVLKRVDAHFIFAGPGLKPDFEGHGIPRGSYSYLGYISEEQKRALHALADVFVLPSFYENFPISILEAMASGTPPVSTPVGGIPEMITPGYNGVLVPQRDAASLADALVRLIESDTLRRKMGRNARDTVLEKFTWRKTADSTLEYYREILEGA